MLIILFYVIIMLCLIAGNKTVISGASYGLMLWYNNVLPLLMPFMLVSGLMASRIKALPQKLRKRYAIIITLFTGLLCGYPLGAKNANDFIKNNSYDKKTGQLMLALVNNCSPMFLFGYIISNLINDKIKISFALFVIYTPYVILIIIKLLFYKLFSGCKSHNKKAVIVQRKKSANKTKNNIKDTETNKIQTFENRNISQFISDNDQIMSTIIQITYVGFYIMICSIISEYILSLNMIPTNIRLFTASLTEITKGTRLIADNYYMSASSVKMRTESIAIILGLTSFGGISAILQTNNVIRGSGMSICKYIIEKTVCGISTYGLVIFLYNYM
ncbi:MAG: hypothetical protein IJV15_02370 [Lachnospiraceae bacterium]|nr:hypothetical protein [Lachnospiraceae bacterium]